MSSGTLPLSTYHRAQSLGDGTYGSVVAVFDDEGNEYALKLFLDDEEEDDSDDEETSSETMDLGALREISILRLLRESNGHKNIVQIADVTSPDTEYTEDDDVGAGTSGCLGMAMPLYRLGTLGDAVDKGKLTSPSSRKAKVHIAHGLLSAVAYLHDNGIIHRDIKADNVMLEPVTLDDGSATVRPVLIDFSLAKVVESSMYNKSNDPIKDLVEGVAKIMTMEGTTHTGEVGTVTYCAPEVVKRQKYGLSSDLWSCGVILLEMLTNHTLTSSKNKQAFAAIKEAVDGLPENQPFPVLIRGLLNEDPKERLTARQALESPLFKKFGLEVPTLRMIDMATALPFDEEDAGDSDDNINKENNISNSSAVKKKLTVKKKKKNALLQKRKLLVEKICKEFNCKNPMTKHAAFMYSQQMFLQLDDTIYDLSESQGLLDCVILASKFFETELVNLHELESESKKGSFENWCLDEYRDNESSIWMLMDHCLYPRVMDDWD